MTGARPGPDVDLVVDAPAALARTEVPAAVDVIIPVFNGERTVDGAVRSILRQTLERIQVIVVDDGSTDRTGEILQAHRDGDPRVTLLRQSHRGIVAALNAGLRRSTAPFIARFDADDVAYPHRLASQLDYLNTHAECVAVSCRARHVDEHGRPTGTVSRLRDPGAADPLSVPAREPYLLHPFLMARRTAVIGVGGYRLSLHSEDSDLYWRLLEGGRLHNMDEILGDYRLHSGSISSCSVHNGRVMAVSSQLAALSAVRRAAGRPDEVFGFFALGRASPSQSIGQMVDLAAVDAGFDRDEMAHLRMAASAKLLELASYRPYEPTPRDCRAIRRALAGVVPGSPANAEALVELCVSTAVRLVTKGHFHAAAALTGRRQVGLVLSRLVFRLGLPERLRVMVKRMALRPDRAR